ncbi:organic solvent tolerance protein [Candidatus Pelagibacter sp.]|nr:organic solvent tolerance protein [Candidatus Pelagibacter sp.]
MKNKLSKLLILFVLINSFYSKLLADEFQFKVTEIQVYNEGNLIKGIKGGKIITGDEMVTVDADYFQYDKLTSILNAKGNVVITDKLNNVVINTPEAFYLKNIEEIRTKGITDVIISNEYFANSKDLIFLRNKSILSSKYKTSITDTFNNLYTLSKFEYHLIEELLKGENIEQTTNVGNPKSEKYKYGFGFFNLKQKIFSAKDFNVFLSKDTFGEKENDPRISSVSATGDEYNTFFDKGIFTSCKKTDKCPPWAIKAKKVHHDKIKKQIIYRDAWLNIYDFPVVYMPKFFHPDPSVKRQSGLLKPRLEGSDLLGAGIHIPYFYVISDDKDLTIKPRFYDDGKYVLQNEYRQKTKKTTTIADFSLTKGFRSNTDDDQKDSRTHLFIKTYVDLQLDNLLRSDLELKYQKTSNDTYLKIFNLDSPLLKGDDSVLESELLLKLDDEDYNFTSSIARFETLSGKNSDRYQYILPSYHFSKSTLFEKFNGTLDFTSMGNNTLKNTNKFISSLTNDFNYDFFKLFSRNGIVNEFDVYLKNLNSVGKNSLLYKNSPQSEIMSTYTYAASYPLIKKNINSISTFEPKLLFQFSPHQMKNHTETSSRLTVGNIYSPFRMGVSDSFEEGGSMAIGFNYKNEKEQSNKKNNFISNKIVETRDFIDFKIGAVFRNDIEKNISKMSSLNQRGSNVVGEFNYLHSKYVNLNYQFSIDNDLNTLEYNSINADFSYKKLSSSIKFLEENGKIGTANILSNVYQYTFDDNNLLKYSTRRNRELNLTEYYDLIYEYQNDCLTAGIKYKKIYYQDGVLKPSEELFFSITIVPLGTFSPDAITRTNY